MRSFGFSVDLIDKYESKAEFKGDLIRINLNQSMIWFLLSRN